MVTTVKKKRRKEKGGRKRLPVGDDTQDDSRKVRRTGKALPTK